MKQWPNDQREIVSFEDLALPITDVLSQIYKERVNGYPTVYGYTGYSLPMSFSNIIVGPEAFNNPELMSQFENCSGISPMMHALKMMYLFGMENGRRMAEQNNESVAQR